MHNPAETCKAAAKALDNCAVPSNFATHVKTLVATDTLRQAAVYIETQDYNFKALVYAVEEILDSMGLDGPNYELDPEDDFQDVANGQWVRATLTKLGTALAAAKE